MATSPRVGRRAAAIHPRFQGLLLVLLVMPLVGGITIGNALAQPRWGAIALSAAQAQEQGSAVSIVRRPDLAPGLAEIRVQAWTRAAAASGAGRLLAVAPGAAMAAVAGRIGPGPASLIVARADGTQRQVELPGLISASFAPDGSWLAAIDGAGSLWRIEANDGQATKLVDGPFLGSPLIEEAGSILALRVSSVEAPFVSRLARVGPDGSSMVVLTDDELVYGAQPLADGGLAVVVHQPSGTRVVRARSGSPPELIADLGQGAVHVAVAASGMAVAWERIGSVYLRELPDGQPQRIASGGRPRFAPDGRSLLVEQPSQTALLDLQGRELATFATQATFDRCGMECRP